MQNEYKDFDADEDDGSWPFHARSAAIMLVGTLVIYGPFFWRSLSAPSSTLDGKIFGLDFIVMFTALIVIAIAGHICVALWMKFRENDLDDRFDVRDAEIERRADQVAGYVCHAGLIGTLAMVLMEGSRFWVAHALLGTMVVSSIVMFAAKLIFYKRGA